jgi:hypothetical protein
MRRVLPIVILVGGVVAAGCGGKDSPVAPTPPPLAAATIQTSGTATWEACLSGNCLFQGEARNTGTGCAGDVRGVIRFFNAASQQIGSAQWVLVAGRIVRPNEAFVYRSTVHVDAAVVSNSNGGSYQSEPAWTNVACN